MWYEINHYLFQDEYYAECNVNICTRKKSLLSQIKICVANIFTMGRGWKLFEIFIGCSPYEDKNIFCCPPTCCNNIIQPCHLFTCAVFVGIMAHAFFWFSLWEPNNVKISFLYIYWRYLFHPLSKFIIIDHSLRLTG